MARPVEEPREGERIAKLLARAGIASRREIERMIEEGRVAKNGVVLDTPATTLTSLDGVTVDGNPVAAPEPARLFLYHKPTGLLVTERDPRGRPTIYDRLPKDLPRLVPVGRLDLNTEGLLLLTTDGGFKRQLELPATGVERTYRARAYGRVSQAQLEELIHGIEIDGIRYGSIDANLERRTGANFWIEMTLTEGKNREVRRVLDHIGLDVSRLIRTRYGPFVLGDLPPGEIGEVRGADIGAFRQALANKRPTGPERVQAAPRPAAARPVRAVPRIQQEVRPRTAVQPHARPQPDAKPQPQTAPQRYARPRTNPAPQPEPHSGAGRGPVAAHPRSAPFARPTPTPAPSARPVRQATRSSATAPHFGTASRRGEEAVRTQRATTPRKQAPTPTGRATGDAARADGDTPARPARIERKTGWAKPKPKPGARPPKKR
ncbi:pseudouridine synthase [Sphingomonas sp.]|uniref:pseudouridine synthase n=1 Tax=Sphingomonas sp. TaxID=28214 RepID=UPI003AFFD775